MPSQRNSDKFRFRREASYQGLRSKVGLLAAAKAAALRINLVTNLKIDGCGVVAPPMHAPSRAPLLLSLILSHNLPFLLFLQEQIKDIIIISPPSLARDGQTDPLKPRLVVLIAHVLHYLAPPGAMRTAL